jgi:DNA topoisomerase-1
VAGKTAKAGTKLVIVESPAKARTIGGYLGNEYVVEASIGHIRDLPRSAADVPAKYKGLPWARIGVDTEHDFQPIYVVSPDRKQQVSKLRSLVKDAGELYLATDEDREGEAIAWHLVETLKPRVPVKRMVFHEITPSAIAAAVAAPRDIDDQLVDAQETRRILDRLYGYEVSPVLWKKVLPRLSAGRVQSVATRMIVERERARMAFRSAEYWDVQGTFAPAEPKPGDPETFTATLVSLDDTRIATGRDFDPATGRAPSGVLHLDEAGARGLAARLYRREFVVQGVEEKPYRRRPYAPFMTSTLQQEAGRKFRWSAATVMRTAQKLYENGFITYMRTDSTNLSETALTAARTQARELYGDAFVPAEPRVYRRTVKNAQEAHEAIRPAGDSFRTPGAVAGQLSGDEFRLYELIWQRTLASQMADAVGTTVSVRLGGTSASGEAVVFTTSGRTITFPGFLRAYVEDVDESPENTGKGDTSRDDSEKRLPQLVRGDALDPREFTADGHSTAPPARYTEPSLVKAMEELGVGRPSTYASIMQTIQDRGYVFKRGAALVPTWTAFAVVGLLESYFGRLVDYGFTASVENDLDDIATGERSRVEWLRRFYFGADDAPADSERISAQGGLKRLIESRLAEIDARGVNSIPLDDTGAVVRVGRYGPYLQRGSDEDAERASIPDDLAPDELTPEKVEQLLSAPAGDRHLGLAADGREITVKTGRYGPYVTDGEKSASLFKDMSPETVTLADAEQLLTLPRSLGQIDDVDVTAQNGRYGPYLKRGKDSRSLEFEEQLFTVTLDEAAAIFAQPKQRGGRTTAKPALKELGPDPVSGKPMVVKDGRFGPYVTDGTANASLRRGDSIDALTDERAAELLAERRSRGPVKRTARRAAATAPAKKTAKRAVRTAPAGR